MWVHVFPQVNMGAVGIVIVQSLLCILALVVFVVWDGEMLVGRRWGEMWLCSWGFVGLEGSWGKCLLVGLGVCPRWLRG